MTPQERTIEEAAKLQQELDKKARGKLAFDRFIAGAKSDTAKSYWFAKFQQEQDRKYSEEEVLKLLITFSDDRTFLKKDVAVQWFEQFKKQ